MQRIVKGPPAGGRGSAGTVGVLAVIAVCSVMAGCATQGPINDPVTASAAGSAGKADAALVKASPAGARPAASTPSATNRAFAEVIKDATESAGLFHVWQKDDKTWLEIAPDQFDQLYSFTVNLSRGLGEKWFFGGMRYESEIVSLRKVGNQVQLIARNQRYFARPATPEARAVGESFADSLLASAPIVSLPHPERNSILIDAGALLLSDIAGANGDLERTFRQPYSFDARNSAITQVRATPDQTSFNVSANYMLSRINQGPLNGSQTYAAPPSTVPDVRSLLLGFYYNFARLPDAPMRPRMADDRLGYNTATRYDFGNDSAVSPRQTYVRRWRIEKADPALPVSDARQPVVFWLDRTIPERYRPTVIAGVLEWNKAFERIGIRNALEVRIQPEDADWDSYDARHNMIRWMTTARPIFGGVAQSVVDPRSGEILNAGIGIDPVRLRNRRFQRVEMVPVPAAPPGASSRHLDALCMRADFAAEEVGFALDLLEARGMIDPDSPEAEEFVLSDLKETVMHEVGHALGLTHNFRASTAYTQAQLNDPAFTRANGIAGSVMEYNPTNIALAGETQGSYSMMTIGPYDYWAIEYGYKPIAADKERVELLKIAARSSEPQLAFAQDMETAAGLDPEAMQGDLGNSPLEFAARRFTLAQELWDRWQGSALKDGDSYSSLRRNMARGLGQVYKASEIAASHIGGMSILRDHAGSTRAPLNPVPMEKQREALRLLESRVFNADNFRFKPEFLRRLSIDYLDRDDGFDAGVGGSLALDYSLPEQILALQRQILGQVMSDGVARRLLDSESKLDNPAQALKLSELYQTLYAAIWSELKSGKDITSIRRNLQREHANRIVAALLRAPGSMPPDARSLLRAQARTLRSDIAQALGKGRYSTEAEAHLSETLATLDESLKAPMVRQGV